MVNSLIVTARHHKTAVRPRPMKRSKRRDECAERGLFKKLGDPRSVLSWALSPSPNLLACIRGQGVSRPASFRPVLPGWVAKERVRLSFRRNNRICPSFVVCGTHRRCKICYFLPCGTRLRGWPCQLERSSKTTTRLVQKTLPT